MILSLLDDVNIKNCKEIYSVTDESPILNDEMLKLCIWLHEYTFCTYFDAINLMLPTGLKFKLKQFYFLNPHIDASNIENSDIINYLFKIINYKLIKYNF